MLQFDIGGVHRLHSALVSAGLDLAADHAGLKPLLDEATTLLSLDQSVHAEQLSRLRSTLDEIEADVGDRLSRVTGLLEAGSAIDRISDSIATWSGSRSDPFLDRLTLERNDLVRELLGISGPAPAAVIERLDRGHGVFETLSELSREAREARIVTIMDTHGFDRNEAAARVTRTDRITRLLLVDGVGVETAVAAASISESLDLDLAAVRSRAGPGDDGLIDALGHAAIASNLGLSIEDAVAIDELRSHFDALDNSTGGDVDGRVSQRDLEFVVANPSRFAPAQVRAAETILDSPVLFERLDTATANDDVLGPDRFGTADGADGIVSLDDLQAFAVKAQLNHVLGDYTDLIDVAADPTGKPDGFVSRADLRHFVDHTPDLPHEVRQAARTMLEAEMFDHTWLEAHRDELALGMAVVAGAAGAGLVIVSAGTATPVAVIGAGAIAGSVASAGTTVAVNTSGDAEDALDDVVTNGTRGGMLGAATAGLPLAFTAATSASTLPAVIVAGAELTSDVATIVWAGGLDIVLPESVEDGVHSVAGTISELAGPTAALAGRS